MHFFPLLVLMISCDLLKGLIFLYIVLVVMNLLLILLLIIVFLILQNYIPLK